MTIHRFSLYPLKIQSSPPEVEIQGTLSRHHNQIMIGYEIAGDIASLMIPPLSKLPTRQHDLWQTTCFEFFIAVKGQSQYWEFNLAPSTHWNVYHFDDYRQGMCPEITFTRLPFVVHQFANSFQLILSVDLSQIISGDQAIEMAIATVLKSKDGQLTYWALHHPGHTADFHHRDGFMIKLPCILNKAL